MSEDFLELHFPKNPIMPGVMLLEAITQLTGWLEAASSDFQNWFLIGRVLKCSFLDFAYVYSSADANALKTRLAQYGKEAGVPLDRYITEQFETVVVDDEPGPDDELRLRRQAIGYLLLYLANADADQLEMSVDAIDELAEQLGRSENHYWYH